MLKDAAEQLRAVLAALALRQKHIDSGCKLPGIDVEPGRAAETAAAEQSKLAASMIPGGDSGLETIQSKRHRPAAALAPARADNTANHAAAAAADFEELMACMSNNRRVAFTPRMIIYAKLASQVVKMDDAGQDQNDLDVPLNDSQLLSVFARELLDKWDTVGGASCIGIRFCEGCKSYKSAVSASPCFLNGVRVGEFLPADAGILRCSHVVCRDCIRRRILDSLAFGWFINLHDNTTWFECPVAGCETVLELPDLKSRVKDLDISWTQDIATMSVHHWQPILVDFRG